ncbi:SDR family NAD(P)-dependent oxidoreductase, partial [Bosea thiooxidans]
VAAIAEGEPAIDALFNNAGVSTGSMQFSPQGLELHFEVNCVAPYVLTKGLSAKLASGGCGRVVNTVSDAFHFLRRFNPESLAHSTTFRKVIGPYANSKLAMALWSKALAPNLARRGIRIVSVAPGPNDTSLVRGPGFPALLRPLARLITKPPAYGADLLFDAATTPYEPGAFVDRHRVRPLPYKAQSARVLALVSAAANQRGVVSL